MLKQQARLVAVMVFLADLVLVSTAFVAAHLVRGRLAPALGVGAPGLPPINLYLYLLPLALAIWSVLLWSSGRYRSHRQVPLLAEAAEVIRVCLVGAGGFALAVWVFRLDRRALGDEQISRAWIALFALFTCALLLAEKVGLRLAARRIRERGLNYRTVLVVGTGPTAAAFADSIRQHRWWGYRLLGFLSLGDSAEPLEPGDPRRRLTEPRLGSLADLETIRSREVVDDVVFAVSPGQVAQFERVVLSLQDEGVLVRFALDLFPHAHAHVELQEIDGIPVISLATSPTAPVALALKRTLDLLLSFVLLVLTLPLTLVAATAIKLTDGGAVLFRQRRCGLNGRLFTLFKFRTMVEGAEARISEVAHLNEMKGPVFKMRHDPRVTPVGRLLRRFSLDELPQLWNVLRGDMSLVGPRPPIPEEVARYEPWQRRRLAMKPGLTGLWQVSGRNQVDFERWMALDLQYIDSWTPWLDLKILARTIPVVLSGRGAS